MSYRSASRPVLVPMYARILSTPESYPQYEFRSVIYCILSDFVGFATGSTPAEISAWID